MNALKEWLVEPAPAFETPEQFKDWRAARYLEALAMLRAIAEPNAALVDKMALTLRNKCGLSSDSYSGARDILDFLASALPGMVKP